MKLRHKFIIKSFGFGTLATALTFHMPVYADVTESEIETAMKKYCVPKGDTICNPNKLAKWNGEGCACEDSGATWNPTTRECYNCAPGTYLKSMSDTSCTVCPAGYKCAGGATQPVICPAGSYNTSTGNSSCATCEAGWKCTGGTNHSQCAAGTYNTSAGRSSCDMCPSGYACSGGTNLSACVGKTWAPVGASSCRNCVGNYVSTCDHNTGALIRCIGGYYKSGSNCYACSKGYFCDGYYQRECSLTTYSNVAATSCSALSNFSTNELENVSPTGECVTGTLYHNNVYTVLLHGGNGYRGDQGAGGIGAKVIYRFRVPQTASYQLCSGNNAGKTNSDPPVSGGGGAGSWLRVSYGGRNYFVVAGGGGGGASNCGSGGGGGGIGAGGAGGDEDFSDHISYAGASVGVYEGGKRSGRGTSAKNRPGDGGKGYLVNGGDGEHLCARCASGGAGGGGGGQAGWGGNISKCSVANQCAGSGCSRNFVNVILLGNSFSDSYSWGGHGGSGSNGNVPRGENGFSSHVSNVSGMSGFCAASESGCAALYAYS